MQHIAKIVQFLEELLLKLLIDNTPPRKRVQFQDAFLDGPVIDPTRADVFSSQGQVDSLLESLGF